MSTRTRSIVAAGLSLAVHAVVLGAGLLQLDFAIEMPEIDVEFETIELVEPDREQGKLPDEPAGSEGGPPTASQEPSASDPDHPTPDEKAAQEKAADKPKEPEKKPEKPKFGEKDSRVDQLGPPSSTFFALLANKRIAKLPFAEAAADIMAPLPDFEYIIEGGGFHPWRDFDAIVIASSDIRDATQTFLAVQSPLSVAEIKVNLEHAAAQAGERLIWEKRLGFELGNPRPLDPQKPDLDPRWFVFLDDGVAIYVREEFLPALAKGPQDKGGKTAGNFVASIAKMRSFLGREPRAGLQVVFRDMRSALKRVKGLPFEFPNDLEVFAEAANAPELVIKLDFLSEKDAEGMQGYWQRELRQIIRGNFTLRMLAGTYYESTTIEREGSTVILRNRFSAEQAELVLQHLASESARQMRRSKEQIAARKAAREELWRARQSGKLTPSQARDALKRNPSPTHAPASSGF